MVYGVEGGYGLPRQIVTLVLLTDMRVRIPFNTRKNPGPRKSPGFFSNTLLSRGIIAVSFGVTDNRVDKTLCLRYSIGIRTRGNEWCVSWFDKSIEKFLPL